MSENERMRKIINQYFIMTLIFFPIIFMGLVYVIEALKPWCPLLYGIAFFMGIITALLVRSVLED